MAKKTNKIVHNWSANQEQHTNHDDFLSIVKSPSRKLITKLRLGVVAQYAMSPRGVNKQS